MNLWATKSIAELRSEAEATGEGSLKRALGALNLASASDIERVEQRLPRRRDDQARRETTEPAVERDVVALARDRDLEVRERQPHALFGADTVREQQGAFVLAASVASCGCGTSFSL